VGRGAAAGLGLHTGTVERSVTVMREFDESTITDAVLERVRQAESPRVRQISEALVRHLHTFVREIEPTEEEWRWGIQFLTQTGQMCSKTRQEFILLSDTLGVSMLVDAINHRLPSGATATTVFGPFYVVPPEFPLGADIRGRLDGRPMHVEGRVLDIQGRPIAGAAVDVWHADDEGSTTSRLWRNPRNSPAAGACTPTRTATSTFGRCVRPPIRFPMMDRWARCSELRAAIHTAPSTSTS
jgi:hypothetical protein